MQREQHWDGLPNVRDLGGLPTRHGHTRSGRVFRSPRPEWLTTAGWGAARSAGVRTLVDLRNAVEVPASGRPPSLARFSLPIEDQTDREFMRVWGSRLGSPAYYPENLRRWPERIVAVLGCIADAEHAVLVHCSAGRDRTGLICAMLLSAADVAVSDILDDYELAVRSLHGYVHPGERAHEPFFDETGLERHVTESRVALAAFLASLDVTSWLHAQGVSDERVERVRTLLL